MSAVGKQMPVTTAGREHLRAELEKLLQQSQEVKARMVEEIRQKDDDFNRYQTHEELALLQARIAQIRALLDESENTAPVAVVDGTVAVGSKVTVRDETGKQQTFTIVTPVETNPTKGFISFMSPVGSELLNKLLGDEVTIPLPRGERKLTIISVD